MLDAVHYSDKWYRQVASWLTELDISVTKFKAEKVLK